MKGPKHRKESAATQRRRKRGKTLEIDQTPLNALKQSADRFRNTFGRPPAKNDKLLFEQYLFQGDDLWPSIRDAARKAGLSEDILFAWQRTEFLISESNHHLFKKSQLREWERAIEEYELLKSKEIDPFLIFAYSDVNEFKATEEMINANKDVIAVLGSFIDRNSGHTTSNGDLSIFLRLYYATRAFNCLKQVLFICENRPSRETLGLIRSVYECHLRTAFLKSNPATADAFVHQTFADGSSISYRIKGNGKIDKNTIVNKKTGKEYPARFSMKIMAQVDGTHGEQIHDELYSFLSDSTHADLREGNFYFSEADGFFHQGFREGRLEVPLIAACVSAVFMHQLSVHDDFDPQTRSDAKYIANRVAKQVVALPGRYSSLEILVGMNAVHEKLKQIAEPV